MANLTIVGLFSGMLGGLIGAIIIAWWQPRREHRYWLKQQHVKICLKLLTRLYDLAHETYYHLREEDENYVKRGSEASFLNNQMLGVLRPHLRKKCSDFLYQGIVHSENAEEVKYLDAMYEAVDALLEEAFSSDLKVPPFKFKKPTSETLKSYLFGWRPNRDQPTGES